MTCEVMVVLQFAVLVCATVVAFGHGLVLSVSQSEVVLLEEMKEGQKDTLLVLVALSASELAQIPS